MNSSDTEKKLRTAWEHATPDVLDKVKGRLLDASENDAIVPMPMGSVRRSRPVLPLVCTGLSAAAVLLLSVNLVLLTDRKEDNIEQPEEPDVATASIIEISPDVSLCLNSSGRVVDVNTLNNEAKDAVNRMNLKGVDDDVAENAIIGALYRNGALKGEEPFKIPTEAPSADKNDTVSMAAATEAVPSPATVSEDKPAANENIVAENDKAAEKSERSVTPTATPTPEVKKKEEKEEKKEEKPAVLSDRELLAEALVKNDEKGQSAAYKIALYEAGRVVSVANSVRTSTL